MFPEWLQWGVTATSTPEMIYFYKQIATNEYFKTDLNSPTMDRVGKMAAGGCSYWLQVNVFALNKNKNPLITEFFRFYL